MGIGLKIGVIAAMLASACTKPQINSSTKQPPICIQEKILAFQKQACRGAYVYEYLLNNQNVFVFNPGFCQVEIGAAVYSADCQYLGNLGGATGNTLITGVEFSSAVLLSNHWKK